MLKISNIIFKSNPTELDKNSNLHNISIIRRIRSNKSLKQTIAQRCRVLISELTYSFAIKKEYVGSVWWEKGFLENNLNLYKTLSPSNYDPKLRLVLRIS